MCKSDPFSEMLMSYVSPPWISWFAESYSGWNKRAESQLQRQQELHANGGDHQWLPETETVWCKGHQVCPVQHAQKFSSIGTVHNIRFNKMSLLQKIFSEFIMVEMLFHAKALEVYTHTFNNLETMDIDKDLEVNI